MLSSTLSALSDRMARILPRIEYCRCRDHRFLNEIALLRYRCYWREDLIDSRDCCSLADHFDYADNTIIVGVNFDGILVGSIRLHLLCGYFSESPTFDAFKDILSPMIDAGQRIIDPTRFVLDSLVSSQYPELKYAMLRIPFSAAVFFKADVALAAVRLPHMPFYSRVLKYKKIADPRAYLLLSQPLGLMAVDFKMEKSSVASRYPFLYMSDMEMRALFYEQPLPTNGSSHLVG